MIELNQKEKALLVTIDVFASRDKGFKAEEEAGELRELAKTAGLETAEELTCHCDSPTPNLFIGKGK
ncbi:MAG: GTPase HflX, partial [Candidatus Omnitrophota bacterium]